MSSAFAALENIFSGHNSTDQQRKAKAHADQDQLATSSKSKVKDSDNGSSSSLEQQLAQLQRLLAEDAKIVQDFYDR